MCIGFAIGDAIGSRWERKVKPSKPDFNLFARNTRYTDDTILTIAVMESLLTGRSYTDCFRSYFYRYPWAGYGKGFRAWAISDSDEPYNSYGNGSCMRVSPVAYAFNTKEEILKEAKKSAEVTHSHEQGILGAQAIALAVFMARKQASKNDIYQAITEMGYDLDNVSPGFEISCQKSVPQALFAFLNSTDFVDTIRRAIFLQGDSDTLACIAASIAQPFYYGDKLSDIPNDIMLETFKRLPDELAEIVVLFNQKYVDSSFKRPAEMSVQAQIYDIYRSIFSSI